MPEERIDPSGIPQFTGNLELLEEKAGSLRKDAKAIRETGASIHTGFQGLSSFYDAPEAEQLFATTKPVSTRADGFGDKLEKVSSALDDYAAEVRPIDSKLKRLRTEATAFVNSIEGDADWRKDEDNTTRNNDLHQDVSVAVAQFWAAERRAANRILRLVGGTPWTADDGSGGDHMYGLSTADMKKAGETPWGKVVERQREWWEVGHHIKSFAWDGFVIDGAWAALKGLGTLVNPWGDDFGNAWSGLADAFGGIGLYTVAPFEWVLDKTLGTYEETADEKRMKQAARDFGKGMVAWDEWGRNPTRAAGLVTFNVLTLGVVGSKAGTAGKFSRTAHTAGRLADPMTYIGKGVGVTVGKLPKISEVAANLNRVTTGLVAKLPDGRVSLPLRTDTVPELPSTPPQTGRSSGNLAVEEVRLPDGRLLTPSGRLLDPDGNLLPANRQVEAAGPRGGTSPPELAGPAGRASGEPSAPSVVNAADNARQSTVTTGETSTDVGDVNGRAHYRDGGEPPNGRATTPEVPGYLEELFRRESPRGVNDPLPSFDEVRQALLDRQLTPSNRSYTSEQGHAYATRVFAGGRADGQTVLAGHGFLESRAGVLTVPPGTSISFYVQHGERIPGLNGVAVESGVYPKGGYVETFHAGDQIPNYTLGSPQARLGEGFSVMEESTTVANRTKLSELLRPGMGEIHWAACREVR
ncbi:hypothetical protein QNO07_06490 [Streptomyces sp. 549]|uniref:putative adhesin n=1 Tax=Streptomyces sp. 549 TaxID=3049076 RepID=UPI0024C24CE8|nr:hypothetical protein [Streptomyces sp. 549]MDK1473071.1 hypothetical protein [Streptomyces sp. 549]